MKTIWKYEVPSVDVFDLWMPGGAEILAAGEQHGGLVMWALVDSDAERATRRFAIVGTGQNAGDMSAVDHIATVIMADGTLVWHVFEITEPEL